MTGAFRTPAGGRIDRARPLAFSFDGRRYTGCHGDTLASALLANGVHLVGRSFKYHRPRGILSAGSEEPNALVTIDRGAGRVTPNLRATQLELVRRHAGAQPEPLSVAGLRSRRDQQCDRAAASRRLLLQDLHVAARILAACVRAGDPCRRRVWDARRPLPDPDRYLHHYAHCDVLVIGAGPAGLAAALAASARGARVMLCDEQAELGGSLLAETDARIDGQPAPSGCARRCDTLTWRADVTLLPRTTAFGWFPDNLIGLVRARHRSSGAIRTRACRANGCGRCGRSKVVIATGAMERPLVFPGNDRPGIMLADAARTYLQRYGVKVGHARGDRHRR